MTKPLIVLSSLVLLLLPACKREEVASASGNASLSLMLKSDQQIAPGETDDVLVTIVRDGFEGNVDIEFSGLPTGVEVTAPGPILRDDTARTYELRAAPTAVAVENKRVTVTASGGGLTVRESFVLTVDRDE